MDDVIDMINSLLKAYDSWKTDKTLDEAQVLERNLDNLRLMIGYRFDDLRSLARAARDLDRYISSYEMQQDLEDSDFSAESLIPAKIGDVFES